MSSSAASGVDALSAEDRRVLEELVEVLERPRLQNTEGLDEQGRRKTSTLSSGKLPGFGEPEEKCGEPTPETIFFCDWCYQPAEVPHVCYRYDCPLDGLKAVRRRAAGSGDKPGVVARIGALRAKLDHEQDEHYVYHHYQLSPPSDFFWRSDQPRERAFQLNREVLDVFDGQGLVAFHPFRGAGDDDRGFWKTLLGKRVDWSDAREQLAYGPHFHVVCAAPKGAVPGDDVTRILQERTGWILERITPRNSNVSVYEDPDLARAVTYCLSHSEVYTDSNGDRRLAARVKGPDVNDLYVPEEYLLQHRANVFDVAERTLGIAPPDLTCNRELRESELRREAGGPLADEPLGGFTGPDVAKRSAAAGAVDAIYAGHGYAGETFGESASSTSTSSSAARGGSTSATRVLPTSTSSSPVRCEGQLQHISECDLELLAELDARADVDASDLDAAYRSYVTFMEAQGLELGDRPEVPELVDRPPPD